MAHLLVAHPGHELLLHGWISRTKPVVHVLTDGSAHSSRPRLARTAELLALHEISGGSPYGASTIAGPRGERQPSANELAIARAQGRHVAQAAAKLAAK